VPFYQIFISNVLSTNKRVLHRTYKLHVHVLILMTDDFRV